MFGMYFLMSSYQDAGSQEGTKVCVSAPLAKHYRTDNHGNTRLRASSPLDRSYLGSQELARILRIGGVPCFLVVKHHYRKCWLVLSEIKIYSHLMGARKKEKQKQDNNRIYVLYYSFSRLIIYCGEVANIPDDSNYFDEYNNATSALMSDCEIGVHTIIH